MATGMSIFKSVPISDFFTKFFILLRHISTIFYWYAPPLCLSVKILWESYVFDIDTEEKITYGNGEEVGPTCLALYNKLQDIQYGRADDKFGWTIIVE